MMIKQLYLNGFSHHLCGSAPRACAGALEKASAQPGGLSRVAGRFFPEKLLASPPKNRNRHFPPLVVFWAFLSQVLTRNASCRAALAGVQAWTAATRKPMPGSNTSAYCQARARLATATLRSIFKAVGNWIESRCEGELPLLGGRVVRVIDGTCISMPDSPQNSQKWPHAGGQKPGCGFPVLKLAGLFCLRTGRLMRFALSSWKQSEYTLARQLLGWIKKGEVVLGDRGFCSWGLLALFQRKGVDIVMRLHHLRKDKAGDSTWKKPQRTKCWSKTLWAKLPKQLKMRIIEFNVNIKGFRTRHIILCTSLPDRQLYPDEAIIELYMRRWKVELYLRDIKVTLGLDIVRSRSPEMVEKEIWMQATAYNMVRALMLESSLSHWGSLGRLSFKGTVEKLREWAALMVPQRPRTSRLMIKELLLSIASDPVPLRPFRSEPRAVKRRPKTYQLLTKPRHEMVVSKSRRQK